jgi:hypothetical protein
MGKKYYIALRNRNNRDYDVDNDTVILGIFKDKEDAEKSILDDKFWISKRILENITSDPCNRKWTEKYREKLQNWHFVQEDELESIYGKNRDTDYRYTYQITPVKMSVEINVE